ncbi:endonuclease/exonuclease/phosphatase family protein [Ancrocorticia populi]|uniref:Endonuclease/exonuclease/phosphatase domain-containing protein n=1 Tax=Ancrocorticia populi TaxID=2175228 RepID=A0A2V1K461_9ACTO|nr:endonuclease/exonuclease/phosphatase family protein [Ancrocorticia populi]MDN6486189.1 endonuclease/exonuclease/phosphatase family protein [Ancrocorticia sp.]PWF26043.1 hypothetical protein DD236_08090 [Ancrocorticia populi]
MRVATFNLQSGQPNGLSPHGGTGQLTTDEATMAAAAKMVELDPDIVCLQEVRGYQGLTFVHGSSARWSETALAQRLYTPHSVRTEKRYGIVMYSMLGVEASWIWRLPSWHSPIRQTPNGMRFRFEEQRRAIVALVRENGQPVFVCGTHLAPTAGLGIRQLHWLEERLDNLARSTKMPRAPRLIMGDLNIRSEVLRGETRYTVLGEGDTFPSDSPRTQIDHVIGQGLKVHGSQAVLMPVSDHRALISEIEPEAGNDPGARPRR